MRKIIKQIRGITMIALVITIIVLLILAGVSITMLTGDNGIIEKAQKARKLTEQSQEREQIELCVQASLDESANIDKETLKTELQRSGFDVNVSDESVCILGKTGIEYTINLSDGKVSTSEKIDNLSVTLEPTIWGIKVNAVASDDKSEIKGYQFSADDSETWTEYQTSGKYDFYFYDVGATSHTIKVRAKNDGGNIAETEETATTLQNDSYYVSTKDEILATIGGRDYYKTNEKGAIAAVMCIVNDWRTPLLVSKEEDAVKYTAWGSTLSSSGSVDYNGKKFYYSSTQYWMPASNSCSTNLPILNSRDNKFQNMEEAANNLLDTYFNTNES